MKRIVDILVEELAVLGLEHVFMITGGGAMHLNDAFGRCKKFQIIFNHHEQASAMAAESYCRLSGKPAVVNVTTGPGGVNALNGIYGAYVDSIAVIVVSGQIKRQTLARNFPLPLRQLGDQEADIISMVRPITKYAVELQSPRRVREVVRKAVYTATHGRPGPVWIDVPLDVQGTLIDESILYDWSPDTPAALSELHGDRDLSTNALGDFTMLPDNLLRHKAREIVDRLRNAKRPVLMGGTGVRIAGVHKEFLAIAELCAVPAVCGWNAYDMIPSDHPCYAGRPGTVGDRPGNFTVQNADFLLVLGCRLNIRQISYGEFAFAPRAWKAHVDVDPAELYKPTLDADMRIQADLRRFMPILRETLADWNALPEHAAYLTWCRERVRRYPVLLPRHASSKKVNPYFFMDRLFNLLEEDDAVVTANGSACVVSFQAAYIKRYTRLYCNSGCASMGYDLPAAIGAAVSGNAKRIICLAGDGSIMMNIQELQTIIGKKLPIIIFLLNNNGYLSIQQTQEAYFSDNILGTSPRNGLSLPDFTCLAEAFCFTTSRITEHCGMEEILKGILSGCPPHFCEVILDQEQGFEPKLNSRKLPDGTMLSPALEDMSPFLPEYELRENHI